MQKLDGLRYLVTYDRCERDGEAAPVAAFACKGDAEDFAINLSQAPIVRKTAGVVRLVDLETGCELWRGVASGAAQFASLPTAVRS